MKERVFSSSPKISSIFLMAEKFTAKEEAEQKAGFGMEGFGAPQQYLDIEDTVTGLREQLEQTFDEDERIKIFQRLMYGVALSWPIRFVNLSFIFISDTAMIDSEA